ncbi:hypothetical protein N7447_007657 [Penicillium robsamsonii]|uniref:uncharacterized protein n=1 Tax=Penicillium robsamsonii TaxID=1792511 RepID=UPI002549550F|nr:uncharacterized protein N7447_007657 [Penicillium robsamsonii]KAJ5817649.1 hypothetical protein N7447_007657 [Penicillium robsamsonii]
MSGRHHDPPISHSPVNATALRQEIIATIFRIRRLRLIVIIPAQRRCSGSPLALAFIYIRPFLTDWDNNNIQWGLLVQANPGQRQTFIEIDITTYPSGTAQQREQNFAFPVYVLKSDSGGRNWQFYRHSTRTTTYPRGLIEELAGLSLM